MLGGVIRSGKLDFNFEGEIQSFKIYNELLTENELINATTNTLTNKIIFKAGDTTKANYFRIPALYTLSNKRVLASADARYGGTHDSPSKINIATSYSDDDGMTWSHPKLALEFEDYAKQAIDWPRDKVGKEEQISGSASFIDSALVEDKQTNKVILMSDFMPAGIGNNNSLKDDSGFKKVNEQLYLKLKYGSESSYNYSIRENGMIYNDDSNTPTEYSVDNYYNLKKEDKYLTIEQYSVKFDNKELVEYKNGNMIKMNIFYKDALFKITPTNFIGYTTSNDSGESWGAPLLLPPLLGIDHNASYLSPGQGLTATKNNRIIFSSYSDKQMVFIISDDNGDTWDEVTYLNIVENTSYGTQLSVIKYSQLINGKSAVILSTPNSTKGRRHGQTWLGYINENDNIIDWNNEYDIDYPRYGYSYSALTKLSNHKIGLLYEKYDSWSREELHLKNILKFTTLTINNITNNTTI